MKLIITIVKRRHTLVDKQFDQRAQALALGTVVEQVLERARKEKNS